MIKERDFSNSLLTAEAILSNSLVEMLASVGPVPTRERFSAVVSPYWGWETTYGEELFAAMQLMDIPPLVPLPKQTKRSTTEKRARDTEHDDGEGTEDRRSTKKKKDDVEIVRGIPEDTQSYFQTFQLSAYSADFDVPLNPRLIDFDVVALS